MGDVSQLEKQQIERQSTMRQAFQMAACVVMLVAGAGDLRAGVFIHAGFINWSANPINELDVAFDGSQFLTVGGDKTIGTFDSLGNFLGSTTFSTSGFGLVRSITYDTNSGNLWINDFTEVMEITTSGSIVSRFETGLGSLNAVTVDTSNDTLWLADFSTTIIRNVTKSGTLLSQFSTGLNWTGIAYDSVGDTLLALESGDSIREFSKTGTNLGTVFASSSFPIPGAFDNEFGLEFDGATGNLYVQSQSDDFVNILHDATRVNAVPEPTSLAIFGFAALGLVAGGNRRRKSRAPKIQN